MVEKRYTIAVVEDDRSMAYALVRVLFLAGFEAFSCASAEEFLAEPRRGDADFLAVDIHLGGMSGIELQDRLEESHESRPIAFMTAFDDQQGASERSGCVAFLHKPFPASELLKAINRTLKCGDTAIPENRTNSQN